MKIRKLFNKRVEHEDENVQVAGDVNAVVSANVNEPGSTNRVSSRQSVARVVQRGGRTTVESEERESSDSSADEQKRG